MKRNKPKPIANSQKRPSRISEEYYKEAFDKKIDQSEIHEKERIRIGKVKIGKRRWNYRVSQKKKKWVTNSCMMLLDVLNFEACPLSWMVTHYP